MKDVKPLIEEPTDNANYVAKRWEWVREKEKINKNATGNRFRCNRYKRKTAQRGAGQAILLYGKMPGVGSGV